MDEAYHDDDLGKNDGGDTARYYLDEPLVPRRARQGQKIRIGAGRKAFRCGSLERRVCVVRRKGRYQLVPRDLLPGLDGSARSALLILSVDSDGEYFLLMVLDTSDAWNTSLRAAVEIARTRWIRLEPSRATTTFRVVDEAQRADPDWASAPSIDGMIRAAFAGRTIDEL